MSLYGTLWRILPGPTPLKVIQVGVLFALVVAALFTGVFPAVAPLMPVNDTTVGQ